MFKLALVAALFSITYAASCGEAKLLSSKSYSTTDGFFHFYTTFITTFSMECSEVKLEDVSTPFYAVVNGKKYEVAYTEDANRLQVSWLSKHSDAGKQTFAIKIYDQAALDKNTPLFTIEHYHPGLTNKAPVSSETVALLVFLGALFYAFRQKSEISH